MERKAPKKPGNRNTRKLTNPPNRCRELREAAGYGLREFAELIGVKSPSLSNYEIRGKGIGKQVIYKAAACLKTDFATLDQKPNH